MACVCEYDDWEGRKRRDGSGPFKDSNGAPVGNGVSSDKMRYDENDEIGN